MNQSYSEEEAAGYLSVESGGSPFQSHPGHLQDGDLGRPETWSEPLCRHFEEGREQDEVHSEVENGDCAETPEQCSLEGGDEFVEREHRFRSYHDCESHYGQHVRRRIEYYQEGSPLRYVGDLGGHGTSVANDIILESMSLEELTSELTTLCMELAVEQGRALRAVEHSRCHGHQLYTRSWNQDQSWFEDGEH